MLAEGVDFSAVLGVLLAHSVNVARVCGCSAGRFIFWASKAWTDLPEVERT